jgi:hypothetical protein
MSETTLHVRCACGWETIGTEREVVPATQVHGRRLHNMSASREEVLAMASPADPPPAGRQSSSISRTRRR